MKSDAFINFIKKPKEVVDVVIDTDTYNEIDDQYALSYLIANEEKLNLKAIYAAPFFNSRVDSPKSGMNKSFDEIKNILHLLKRDDLLDIAYHGSTDYLPNEEQPVISDAAKDLAQRAMNYTPEKPLYVIAIAAITNVASAILLNPQICKNIVVVWLGGHALNWPNTKEFNLRQDIAGARVLFNSSAPIVLLPCMGVVSAFATTKQELEYWLKGKNDLCNYLIEATCGEAVESKRGKMWSKPIWDVTAVAWLLSDDFMYDRIEHLPVPTYDGQWTFPENNKFIRCVYHINRDKLFEDLFTKLANYN